MTGDCQPETETEPETEPGVRGIVLIVLLGVKFEVAIIQIE